MINVDIWNINETNFWIGCRKTYWDISTHAKKPLIFKDSDNWDYVTSIKTISDRKCDIPFMLILVGINILEKWVKNNFYDNIGFVTSRIGHLNADITFA